MDYIINFLSLLIIWSIIYYYMNNYDIFNNKEHFQQTNSNDQLCKFDPWGSTQEACEARCFVSGISSLKSEIGPGCTKDKCRDICIKCTDPNTCNWLDTPKILTETETHDNMICIPGNKRFFVYFYNPKKRGYIVLQYYKSRYPHEGIYIRKIKNDSPNYQNVTIDEHIENEFEYSVSFYHTNTDTDIKETTSTGETTSTLQPKDTDKPSKVVKVVPSKYNSIIRL